MTAKHKRWILSAVLAMVVISLLAFQVSRELRGPKPEMGFESIFGQSPPVYVRDLRIKYYTHLKGYGIYLSLVAEPERLVELLGFAPDDCQPLYFPDVDHFQQWRYESTFKELLPNEFPDLKKARIHTEVIPGELREFVICPETGHVFCYFLSDSDLNR